MLGELLAQHLGVHPRMKRQEGRAEAGAEGGRGLGHAPLGARYLRGVARDELVHRLLRGELGDRGQDPVRIGGEEDDVGRVSPHPGRFVVRDELDRIARPGVLGQTLVVEVGHPRDRVEDHILEDGAEPLAGGPDLRFSLGAQPDHLGVAPALEIEHPLVAPAMLVVADEAAGRIGAEGGLPGARQPEEDGGILVGADVGRAVHREDALLGEEVVEDGEDALLELPGVPGAADDDEPPGEVQHHEGAGPGAVDRRVGLELWRVQDGEAGLETCQRLG